MEQISFRGYDFFIKRDDLLSSDFSGNKARKFAYFLLHDINATKLISYGSNQSNAMYSLSVLAKRLNIDFHYVCSHIPKFLYENPIGNYKEALKNGMKIHIDQNPEDFSKTLVDNSSLYIKEGGAIKESEFGIKMLANEINSWAKNKKYDIFLPSGTGTTALFLQKHTHLDVYTCPCVGNSTYLTKQFFELEIEKNHPTILNPPKKYHFGKLKKDLYEIYFELKKDTNIEFDLLYDPVGWITLLKNIQKFKNPIIYIHQGGILGNVSLLQRYKRKFG